MIRKKICFSILIIIQSLFLSSFSNVSCSLKKIPLPLPKLTLKDLEKYDTNKVLQHFSIQDLGWIYLKANSKQIVLTDKKRSSFFNFSYHKLAQHFDLRELDNENLAVIYGAFQDYEKNISPLDVCHFSYMIDEGKYPDNITNPFHDVLANRDVIYKIDYSQWQKEDFEKLKNESRSIMAHRYKIHLQVKPEYLISFALDLAKMLHETQLKKLIPTFKITKSYIKGAHIPGEAGIVEHAVPIVVLYPTLLPGERKTKNKILKAMLKKITSHYKDEVDKISLNVKPRFNYKINELVWLSGGCSCHKYYYRKFIKKHQILNTLYTDDFTFMQGYDYK